MSKQFMDTVSSGNNLLIVDGFNMAFRWKHSGKRNFAAEYLQTIMSFANSYSARKVVVLSDGGSDYRRNIFPDYKGDRKRLQQTQSEEDAKAFEDFLNDWKVAFELCGTQYHTIQYNGVEADDIAAYLSINEKINNAFDHIWLLSTDKDWDLLINSKVSKFSYRTRKETRLDNWNEHYQYAPEDHISIKALQGDKSDSIPGVNGIGDKRAYNLVKEYGTAFDIYEALPIDDKRVFIQNLNSFGDQILLNYELMDLVTFSEEAIGDNIDHLNKEIKNICQ